MNEGYSQVNFYISNVNFSLLLRLISSFTCENMKSVLMIKFSSQLHLSGGYCSY